MIRKTIEVNLGARSYIIHVGHGILSSLAPILQQRGISGRIVLITDSHVSSLYLKPIEKHLRQFAYNTYSIVVPPGERQKSLTRASTIFTELLEAGADRNSTVVALGGGVIGDLAGFVAATYQRGIALVQMPTTLLAQVDSSVGGKVAVNHPLGKNMIGAFHQPLLVWVDSETLATLPRRELVCGMGEIVKYGIALDHGLFAYLESNLDEILKLNPERLLHVQARCLEIKSRIVSEDERETGTRTILNLGHTVGHALEGAGNYRMLKHGEAVLLGIMAESYVSKEMGLISADIYERIVGLIRRLPLNRGIARLRTGHILRLMRHDKKSTSRITRFALPVGIGEARTVDRVDFKLVADSLKYLRTLKV